MVDKVTAVRRDRMRERIGQASPTSQHLIKSLADEKYFKDESGAA
jgi:hypothetical protein